MIKQRLNNKESGEKIQIGNHFIQFPYVPYECQREFMAKVLKALDASTNAALESPTGTGKTLSLLCAAIAWVQEEKAKIHSQSDADAEPCTSFDSSPSTMPKIYYASRTHLQLQQVVRELNKTVYKSKVRIVTLAGREQLCLKKEVLKEKNSVLQSHICRTMERGGKCVFYNKLMEENIVNLDEIYEEKANGRAMDIEDMKGIATNFNHCPFNRARQMFERANLILLPYNYLLDPKLHNLYVIKDKVEWIIIYNFRLKVNGSILIFDEGHNIEKEAEEAISIDFSTKTLAEAIEEAKYVLKMVKNEEEEEEFCQQMEMDNDGESFLELSNEKKEVGEKEKMLNKEEVSNLLEMLLSFKEQIDALDQESGGETLPRLDGKYFPGPKMIELMRSAQIHRNQRDKIRNTIDRIGLFLAKNADNNKGIWAIRGTSLIEFSALVSCVFIGTSDGHRSPSKNATEEDASVHFLLFIDKKGGALELHYWCFNAAVTMRYLESQGTRSILLSSSTLAPMDTFKNTMGIHFGEIFESGHGHCARQDNLIVGIIKKGPDPNNVPLLGTYENRNTDNYKEAVGELLLKLMGITPHGMLVFFPSYAQMGNFISHWKCTEMWAKLDRQKQIFCEPTNKTEIQNLLRDFDTAVRAGGAILFAVCRGKLSEGIDFPDSHCRTLVIVSIPFAPIYEPKILLKKEYLKRYAIHKRNPNEWYENEAIRAVNQALGRIIRHKDDFGTVILADSRYAEMNRQVFPSWIRPSIQIHPFSSDSILPSIRKFFIERRGFLFC